MRSNESPDDENRLLPVEFTLEQCLLGVEAQANAYVEDRSASNRENLISALDQLDERAEFSDRLRGSLTTGVVATGWRHSSTIGVTRLNGLTQQILGTEFEAQVNLVKAAKAAIEDPCDESTETLRVACIGVGRYRDRVRGDPPIRHD